jgi:hypothetical protein
VEDLRTLDFIADSDGGVKGAVFVGGRRNLKTPSSVQFACSHPLLIDQDLHGKRGMFF